MIVLTVGPGVEASVIKTLRDMALRHPGPHLLQVRCAGRQLTFGPGYALDASAECMATLSEFGATTVAHEGTGPHVCGHNDGPTREEPDG